jgi:ABC-type lipoprotein release transport system permease subunit
MAASFQGGATQPEARRRVRIPRNFTAIGVAAGVIAALALAGRIEPLLFEIPPRDPVTFVVVLTLHIVAALASSIPAWKASRVDPNIALRAD